MKVMFPNLTALVGVLKVTGAGGYRRNTSWRIMSPARNRLSAWYWTKFHVPCSHAIKAAREFGVAEADLVTIYSSGSRLLRIFRAHISAVISISWIMRKTKGCKRLPLQAGRSRNSGILTRWMVYIANQVLVLMIETTSDIVF